MEKKPVVSFGDACAAARRGRGAGRDWIALCLGMIGLMAGGCAATQPVASNDREGIVDRIVASTAKVVVEANGRPLDIGSGVVVASHPEGASREAVSYVLTADHVLGRIEGIKISVRFTGAYAKSGPFAATIAYRSSSEALDLALLKVRGIAVPAAALPALEEQTRLGDGVLLVGFPWGKRLGVFSGIVSQMPADDGEGFTDADAMDSTMVVDAASSKGVSGGGVFRKATGTLIGVVEGYQTASIAVKNRSSTYSISVPMPGETFVVPFTRIRGFLRDSGAG